MTTDKPIQTDKTGICSIAEPREYIKKRENNQEQRGDKDNACKLVLLIVTFVCSNWSIICLRVRDCGGKNRHMHFLFPISYISNKPLPCLVVVDLYKRRTIGCLHVNLSCSANYSSRDWDYQRRSIFWMQQVLWYLLYYYILVLSWDSRDDLQQGDIQIDLDILLIQFLFFTIIIIIFFN